VLLGNYFGTPGRAVTPLAGIRAKLDEADQVLYAQGTDWAEGLPLFDVVPASALQTTRQGQTSEGLTGEYFATARAKVVKATSSSSTLDTGTHRIARLHARRSASRLPLADAAGRAAADDRYAVRGRAN
jgi:hypothetical protein